MKTHLLYCTLLLACLIALLGEREHITALEQEAKTLRDAWVLSAVPVMSPQAQQDAYERTIPRPKCPEHSFAVWGEGGWDCVRRKP